jgi:uncharacterized protein YbjT (DUF2867 family)
MAEAQASIALLAGASGLLGSQLLELLLVERDFQRIYAVTRRPLGREHARLANRIVPFERLEAQLKGLTCQVAFCCLGASAREARDEDAAQTVELDHVLAFARSAKLAGAQRFVYASCAAAQPRSNVPALRMKAEAEGALEQLGFASLDILQPGPLLGLRRQMGPLDLARWAAMPLINALLRGPREAHRGISAAVVAQAMLGATRSGRRGVYRYNYASIQALAQVRSRAAAKSPGGAAVPKSGRPP